VQHVLNRSPDVCLAPETHYFKRARRLRFEERLREARSPAQLRAFVDVLYTPDRDAVRGCWAWMRRNVPADEFAERLWRSNRDERALFDLLMELYAERRAGTVPRVVGEKTPEHFLHLPRLLAWYPEARIVHTFRDPRATYVSELRRRRQGRWGLKTLVPALPDAVLDPVLPMTQLVHTTVRWGQAVKVDRTTGDALGPRYLRLRYEDLVADPETRVRELCAFAGIEYTDALLDVGFTGSSYSDARHAGRGIAPRAADRWREHVGPVARRWFSFALGSRLRAYGYAR
jgi:hypothetical protein